jgi:serine phosphatase RsbU (regulator of sigma subunit)
MLGDGGDRENPTGADDDPFEAEGRLEAFRARYAKSLSTRGGVASLERLAALAMRLLGSAAAQVSIISDGQVIAGGAGLAASTGGVQTSAAAALSSLVVQSNAMLELDDALNDHRVKHLRHVADGVIGAYLGVPLVMNGHGIGALCVFDRVPRSWTADDVALLTSAARSVIAELELAALEANYEDERAVWQLAIDAGGVGAFDWDLLTGELRWDERLLELFGLDRTSFGGTIEAFNASVHPEDRARVTQALKGAIASCGDFAAEYRVTLPSGAIRWIGARGRALAGADGSAVRLIGAASDTTAAQDQEARVGRVLESMPTAFFNLDRDWRFTYANSEAKRLLSGIGTDVIGNIIGGNIWDLFPAALSSDFETHYRHAMDSGQPVTFEAYYPPPLDAWYEVRGWPSPDGLAVYFIDISERHRAQEELARLSRRALLLAEATSRLASTLDTDDAVASLAELIVPELGDWCLITLVDSGDVSEAEWRRGLREVGAWHRDPAKRPLVERYSQGRLTALRDDSFFARVITTGESVLVPNAAEAIANVLNPGQAQDLIRELNASTAVAVPLRARGRTTGVLTVFLDPGRRPPSAEAVATLQEVADRAALSLDNARLFAQQRDLAAELQRSMLTAPPQPDHLHIAVRYHPAAEAAQVGGDWYDAFIQPDGATSIVIGDVVGHDTASAAAMGQLRNILRGIAVTTNTSPADLLRQVDTAMARLGIETTATVAVARFEQTEQEREQGVTRMRWSNAGHPPPIVIAHPDHNPPVSYGPTSAHVLWGPDSNLLLGLDPNYRRDETAVTLERGSTVLLYTDGLVERRGELIDIGIDKLTGIFNELVEAGFPLEDLCDELLRRMLPAKPDDDVALIAVRLHREDEPRPAEAARGRLPASRT